MAEKRSIAQQKRAYTIKSQQEMNGTISGPDPSWESKKAAMRQIDSRAKATAAAQTREHKARQNATVHKVTKKKG